MENKAQRDKLRALEAQLDKLNKGKWVVPFANASFAQTFAVNAEDLSIVRVLTYLVDTNTLGKRFLVYGRYFGEVLYFLRARRIINTIQCCLFFNFIRMSASAPVAQCKAFGHATGNSRRPASNILKRGRTIIKRRHESRNVGSRSSLLSPATGSDPSRDWAPEIPGFGGPRRFGSFGVKSVASLWRRRAGRRQRRAVSEGAY